MKIDSLCELPWNSILWTAGYVGVKHLGTALEMIVAEKLSCADMQRNVYNSETRGHIRPSDIGLMNQIIIAWDDSRQARQQQSSYPNITPIMAKKRELSIIFWDYSCVAAGKN